MKKEFLLGLGIAEDLAKQIMDENGKDITREQGKLSPIAAERDAFKAQLDDVEGKLKAFDGVDVDKLKGEITTLQTAMKAEADKHQAELTRHALEAETAQFLASKTFVNNATREFYAGKLNGALGDPSNAGKSREDLLKAYTTGEDGKAIPNIFAEDKNPKLNVNFPPVGPIAPEKLAQVSGQMATLSEATKSLNEHRLIK